MPQTNRSVNRHFTFGANYPDGSYARTISLTPDAASLLRRLIAEQFTPPLAILTPLIAELKRAGIELREAVVDGPDGRNAKTLAMKLRNHGLHEVVQ